jgi:hypothetical protein
VMMRIETKFMTFSFDRLEPWRGVTLFYAGPADSMVSVWWQQTGDQEVSHAPRR